jgi:hypothetical protein
LTSKLTQCKLWLNSIFDIVNLSPANRASHCGSVRLRQQLDDLPGFSNSTLQNRQITHRINGD